MGSIDGGMFGESGTFSIISQVSNTAQNDDGDFATRQHVRHQRTPQGSSSNSLSLPPASCSICHRPSVSANSTSSKGCDEQNKLSSSATGGGSRSSSVPNPAWRMLPNLRRPRSGFTGAVNGRDNKRLGLDSSFVNVSSSAESPMPGDRTEGFSDITNVTASGGRSATAAKDKMDRNIDRIQENDRCNTDYILGEALYFACVGNNGVCSLKNEKGGTPRHVGSDKAEGQPINGSNLREVSQKLDAFLDATMDLTSKNEIHGNFSEYFCISCLDRIDSALEGNAVQLEHECSVYEEAAIAEEERKSSIKRAWAKAVIHSTASPDDSVDGSSSAATEGIDLANDEGGEEVAIRRAIESVRMEIDALANSCRDQENEMQLLQSLLQNQQYRSKTLAADEDAVLHAWNELEIDARDFGEESEMLSKRFVNVMEEVEALDRVALLGVLFRLTVGEAESGLRSDEADCNDSGYNKKKSGRYPQINNLRLAYRTNGKAHLDRAEVNAAWAQAAHLLSFACELIGDVSSLSSSIRIVPLSYPCAKIKETTSDGRKNVHNLGWESVEVDTTITTLSLERMSDHISFRALSSFLLLLGQVTNHIVVSNEKSSGVIITNNDTEALYICPTPFQMCGYCIGNVDVSKLEESDVAAWSSVVYCMAANLKWLSELSPQVYLVL